MKIQTINNSGAATKLSNRKGEICFAPIKELTFRELETLMKVRKNLALGALFLVSII